MSNRRYHLRSALLSAVGFGFGFGLGTLLVQGVFTIKFLDSFIDLFQRGQLLVGLMLVIIVTGLGGAIGGAIGGLTLSYAHQTTRRVGYVWRGALSFGVSYSLLIIPLTLVVSLISFYDLEELSPVGLMIPFWVLGAIFGAVSGLILGLLTVGRTVWRVFLVSALGFAFGGSALGYGLWGYLLGSIEEGAEATSTLYLGLFVFGAVGGGALGYLYSWLAHRQLPPSIPVRFSIWFKSLSPVGRVIAAVGLALLLFALRSIWLISPFTAKTAPLGTVLELKTIDTHWSSPLMLVENAVHPAVFAAPSGVTAVTWVAGTDIFYTIDPDQSQTQSTSVNISNSQAQSTNPQLVVDSTGIVHVVWLESNSGSNNSDILYSRCNNTTCNSPVRLSNVSGLTCLVDPSGLNDAPGLAIDQGDTLMAAWPNGQRNLLFTTWPAKDNPPETPMGCISTDGENDDSTVQQVRVAGATEGTFGLVFTQLDGSAGGEIYLTKYSNNNWAATPEFIDEGIAAEIFIDSVRQIHVAWCDPDDKINYWNSAGETGQIPSPPCTGRPELAQGGNNAIRLVWYSDKAENVLGATQPNTLLYESFQTDEGWTEPAIVTQTAGVAQPAMAVNGDGQLHLAWTANAGEPSTLHLATHKEYDCSGVELSNTTQAVFDAIRQESLPPDADPIPYCYNRFDRLMFAPNPVPDFSEVTPTPNGTFDKFAELAKTAQYEVVFATMWYDSFNKVDNPGRVLGRAIAELYQNLKEDPSRYPKGLTVRLLLGNPPSFAFFPTFNNQAFSLINDLRAAGVPELRNDELGWNVEVGNFSGAWPHSHTKLMVVDGKTVQSVGYNMQHTHLPQDHASGKGKGRVDLGLQVTGPVAQTSLRAFDDLWQASTHIHCQNIDPNSSFLWMFSCSTDHAVAEHVPEVLRFYVPEGTGNAFSIYRTQKYKEGDEAHSNALSSATETMDVIHINFSLDLICALNILIDACNYANRVEYMDAMMHAIEKNDVKARILVSDVAWVGIENNIAIDVFEEELAARGLSDNVEIRYFEQDMHIKSTLVDSEFLVVGNQNFHYSAWGDDGSLAEFNVGLEEPHAIEAFQRYFDYYWGRAKKRE